MIKILKVLIVALMSAVLLTLSSGCVVTTNTTQNNQATSVSETSGHLLVQALVKEDANISSYKPLISVTWLNDTSAHEHFVRNDTSDIFGIPQHHGGKRLF